MSTEELFLSKMSPERIVNDILLNSWENFDEQYEELIYSEIIRSTPPDHPLNENIVYLAATYLETRLRQRDRFQELVYVLKPYLNPEWSVSKRLQALIPVYNQTNVTGFTACLDKMIIQLADSVNSTDLFFSLEQKQCMALNIFAESVLFAYKKLHNIGQEGLFSNEILPKILIKISDSNISDRLGLLGEYFHLCSSVPDITDYSYPWKSL